MFSVARAEGATRLAQECWLSPTCEYDSSTPNERNVRHGHPSYESIMMLTKSRALIRIHVRRTKQNEGGSYDSPIGNIGMSKIKHVSTRCSEWPLLLMHAEASYGCNIVFLLLKLICSLVTAFMEFAVLLVLPANGLTTLILPIECKYTQCQSNNLLTGFQ